MNDFYSLIDNKYHICPPFRSVADISKSNGKDTAT